MRFIITILLVLLFDWYAFQAFQTLSASWSQSAQLTLYGLYWAIPTLALGLILLATTGQLSNLSKETFSTLRTILVLAYFGKFLIILVLMVDDLRHLFLQAYHALASEGNYDKSRSAFVAQVAVMIGTIPFFLLSYGMIRNRYRYKIFNEKVRVHDLPNALEGLKIVQISDIHSGSLTLKEPIRAAIELINQQQADLVFFTGDLVNTFAAEMRPFMDVFDKIKAKYGIYSITGNHDYGDYARWESAAAKQANFQEFTGIHRKLGWDLLLNENRMITINGETIAVIGVENYSAQQRFSKYGDLAKAYAGTEGAALKLLLSHDPSHWEHEVVEHYKDIAITFSGHTHGMQFGIEIPGWIKWSPIKYIYKQWAGLYECGKQYLYVNRGFGFLGYPGRVGILPEITVLELQGVKA